jgi:hypothetical protein
MALKMPKANRIKGNLDRCYFLADFNEKAGRFLK